jgi:KipI family sensor histidine kinase inhibitor
MIAPTLMINSPRFLQTSDSSLLISFGDEISEGVHQQVARATYLLLNHTHPAILNLHPAYSSILVSFNPSNIQAPELTAWLQLQINKKHDESSPERNIAIPVCYGNEFGPDLADLAAYHGLSKNEVISIHTSVSYLVYFLGFAPGFPYLGGMPQRIATPRLSRPRARVPAGSVAIGGLQTGIYPVSTPGGWRIIGRTPLKLFDPDETPPTLFQMGDRVRFTSISLDEFDSISEGR